MDELKTSGRLPVTEPRITDNARVALGFVAGRMFGQILNPCGFITADNALELENIESGNRFRLTILQISGVE